MKLNCAASRPPNRPASLCRAASFASPRSALHVSPFSHFVLQPRTQATCCLSASPRTASGEKAHCQSLKSDTHPRRSSATPSPTPQNTCAIKSVPSTYVADRLPACWKFKRLRRLPANPTGAWAEEKVPAANASTSATALMCPRRRSLTPNMRREAKARRMARLHSASGTCTRRLEPASDSRPLRLALTSYWSHCMLWNAPNAIPKSSGWRSTRSLTSCHSQLKPSAGIANGLKKSHARMLYVHATPSPGAWPLCTSWTL
mmetsp:Transcript_50452/g.153447  ORF Transcript_50452/g.153447 Transcript_50452/m.153447 type:complete len:260 (-) Transcript_50452:692-1471(-)